MFDLENLFRFSVFSMCTHIKDCFLFLLFLLCLYKYAE